MSIENGENYRRHLDNVTESLFLIFQFMGSVSIVAQVESGSLSRLLSLGHHCPASGYGFVDFQKRKRAERAFRGHAFVERTNAEITAVASRCAAEQ